MTTTTVSETAREAVTSACARVDEGGPNDAVDGVPVGLVARPGSTEEVGEVLRAAAGHGLSVVPRGRGTKMSWGHPPTTADVVVDVSGLDQVLDHAAGDLIVVTQAGTTMAELQRTVGGAGQRLVVEETIPGASVGGTLAVNASGPERMQVGTARDLLIGVTVVRADGVVAKAGGRVVKNVAGYDLGKLAIGSFGTLAVITEAIFRCHPVPETRSWVSVEVDDVARAHELAQSVVHAQTVPNALELDWAPGGSGHLAVMYGGRPNGVEARVAATRALFGDSAEVLDEAPQGWGVYPWPTRAGQDTPPLALKLTFVLSGFGEVLGAVRETGAHVRGSAGTGVLYASLPVGDEMDGADVAAVVQRLREVCTRHEGALVVIDGPRELKAGLDVWGPVPALDLMRRVKARFDPDHRLAPGRYVGGI